jgi:hypothetical protein
MGMDSPEEGEDADYLKPGAGRFLCEFPAADHLNAGLAPFDPATECPLGSVQEVGTVEGQDKPPGTGAGEFIESGPPFFRAMEMMEETQGEDEREGSVMKRQALGHVSDYSHRISRN